MPIYEFRCRQCRKKTTALVLSRDRISEVRCSSCGGADLDRLWSRFATPKSEDARLDALADPSSLGGLDENDPAAMMRWMKRMGQQMGEDVGDLEQAFEEEMSSPGGEDGAGGSGEAAGDPGGAGTSGSDDV